MNNLYYFRIRISDKQCNSSGVYEIKYNGKTLIVPTPSFSFVASSFSEALSIISEDEIDSIRKSVEPIIK